MPCFMDSCRKGCYTNFDYFMILKSQHKLLYNMYIHAWRTILPDILNKTMK